MGRTLALLFAAWASLLVSACGDAPRDGPVAEPALYEIYASWPAGSQEPAGWLFGTIHALPTGTRWQDARIDAAIKGADVLVVEANDLDNTFAIARTFVELARSDGLPPLAQRVEPEQREALSELLEKADLGAGQFDALETWAAALTIGAKLAEQSGLDGDESTDLALLDAFDGRSTIGLETARAQLEIFDGLAPEDQQALLVGMLEDGAADDPGKELSEAWMRGDMDKLVAITEDGMDGAPGLRNALLTRRNAAWVAKIEPLLKSGKRPLVAVGAGHIGGDGGLIDRLEKRGYRVTRVD